MPRGIYVRKTARKTTKDPVNGQVHDAIVYLRIAHAKVVARIRDGKLKDFDESHLLAALALRTLGG